MTTDELQWPVAIARVLEDAGQPLHYQDVTNRIGSQGLRDFSSSRTPANTVASRLGQMIKEGDSIYNPNIRKVGVGIYEFIDPSLDTSVGSEESNENDEVQPDDEKKLVPAFGLFWDKDNVSWGRNAKILGREGPTTIEVNFADQNGIYLLHRDAVVVYVGQTTDSLLGRLRHHNRDKNLRWNKFSWFGMREVHEDGTLGDLPDNISAEDLITIMEAVLIEALEPPLNGQRGNRMGELYEQVVDSQMAKNQAIELLRVAVS